MRFLLLLALAGALGLSIGATASTAATSHRSWCHARHTCPSDHATYRWGRKHLLCVKPSAEERNSSFKKRIRYKHRTYDCRR